jgi:hypothetical protein
VGAYHSWPSWISNAAMTAFDLIDHLHDLGVRVIVVSGLACVRRDAPMLQPFCRNPSPDRSYWQLS